MKTIPITFLSGQSEPLEPLVLDFDDQPSQSVNYTTNIEIANVDATIYFTIDDIGSYNLGIQLYINTILTTVKVSGTNDFVNQTVAISTNDDIYVYVHTISISNNGTIAIQLDDAAGDVVDTFTYQLFND